MNFNIYPFLVELEQKCHPSFEISPHSHSGLQSEGWFCLYQGASDARELHRGPLRAIPLSSLKESLMVCSVINSVWWWIAISVTEAGFQSQRGRICLYDFFGSNQCFMLDCYMKPWKKWTWKNMKNVCFMLLVHFTARFYGDIQWWLP